VDEGVLGIPRPRKRPDPRPGREPPARRVPPVHRRRDPVREQEGPRARGRLRHRERGGAGTERDLRSWRPDAPGRSPDDEASLAPSGRARFQAIRDAWSVPVRFDQPRTLSGRGRILRQAHEGEGREGPVDPVQGHRVTPLPAGLRDSFRRPPTGFAGPRCPPFGSPAFDRGSRRRRPRRGASGGRHPVQAGRAERCGRRRDAAGRIPSHHPLAGVRLRSRRTRAISSADEKGLIT